MKVSSGIVQKLAGFDLPDVDELVNRINSQLGGVEEVIDLGKKYKDAKIVKVVECEKHPNADKLSVCMVDVGKDELVQIVCGANNVHTGMWVVWLPPKSAVPSTFDDAEPFVLGARELRGVMSNGMLASARELAIGDDHDGIIDIKAGDLPEGYEPKAGDSFAKVFGLDDTIIDIENKMFTHRPDLFGQLGVAREIAGIYGKQFSSPDWYKVDQKFAEASGLELEVSNDALEMVPRFTAVAIRSVNIEPSPLWLQCALVAMGSKPINNIVDATNYIMLMTAQPVHAYDYDKLRGKKLGVRMASTGEKLTLLNGKTYELDADDIVIVDGEGAIGLAGIMGGLDSEVTSETKSIVLEVANFDMYAVRKTAMRHGVFTDALTRFNKGQSPLQTAPIISELMRMIDGEQASQVFDIVSERVEQALQVGELYSPMSVKPKFIRDRLGVEISKYDMVQMLGNVEFPLCQDCGWNPDDKEDNDDDLHINIPFWRTDIEHHEDVVEEIGRLYGFDRLPRELPMRSTKPAPKNSTREVKQKIRESLQRTGANEVLTYSFVHENILKKAEQDVSQAFRLSNALSPDLQYYRLSVLPSLLDKVHMNIKAGHDEFTLFEIGKGHNKKYHGDDDEGLPSEINFVDLVYASKKSQEGAPYFYVRRLLQQLALDFGFTLRFKPVAEPLDFPVTAPFDLSRSATVETRDGEFIGMVGELRQSVVRGFKLPEYVAAMTLDLEGLKRAIEAPRKTYAPLSRYPSTSQDISLKTKADMSYEDLFSAVFGVASAGELIDVRMRPIAIYQSEDDPEAKTTTFRLEFTSHERTLSDKDIAPIMKDIARHAHEKLGASVV